MSYLEWFQRCPYRERFHCISLSAGGIDYGFFPTSVFPALTLILASETSVRYPIPIKNDDIIEKTENFSVTCVFIRTQ